MPTLRGKMIKHNKKQKNITYAHESNMSTQTNSQMTQMLEEAENSFKGVLQMCSNTRRKI